MERIDRSTAAHDPETPDLTTIKLCDEMLKCVCAGLGYVEREIS